jgi:hypothetical protein
MSPKEGWRQKKDEPKATAPRSIRLTRYVLGIDISLPSLLTRHTQRHAFMGDSHGHTALISKAEIDVLVQRVDSCATYQQGATDEREKTEQASKDRAQVEP